MEEIYFPSSDGVHTVHACIWRPECQVKGILQIIHGMEEYAARYAPFAEKAAELGFLVCAEDHLGHGKTANGDFGHFPAGGEEFILNDISALAERARQIAPQAPYFVMGHSMGSFFCRAYIAGNQRVDGAVIMGTGYKGALTLVCGRALAKLVGLFKGRTYKSPLIKKIAFGSYNRRFSPAPTGLEWLSKDGENIKNYAADPLCGFGFTCGGYEGLFSIMRRACARRAFASVRKDMPILIVSGADDPVGDYSKGVLKVFERYKRAGAKNVRVKLYSGARHEILNDVCAAEAADDVLSFLNECVKCIE